MAMTLCRGAPIMHDFTRNLKGVLVFADQFFRCKVVYIKPSFFFFSFLDMFNLITDTVIYITESKLTRSKEK